MAPSLDDTGIQQSGQDGKVTITFNGRVAILEMKCGDNRLNPAFITKMNAALDQVERNQDCKAIITTGSGKFYSNGLDLQWLTGALSLNPAYDSEFMTRLSALYCRILTFPMPTVAAINGHAYAGGAFLSLAHDYRVMKSERGFWCVNEVHLGMRLRPFMMGLLRERIRDSRFFSEVVFNGKRLNAERAVDMQIVSKAIAGDQLLDGAMRIANEAAGPNGLDRTTLQTLKRDAFRQLLKIHKYTSFDDIVMAKL